MLTKCRVNNKTTVTKDVDGRLEVFSVMWITKDGRLAGAKFQRCRVNKKLAKLVDGPYYLRVLKTKTKKKPHHPFTENVAAAVKIAPAVVAAADQQFISEKFAKLAKQPRKAVKYNVNKDGTVSDVVHGEVKHDGFKTVFELSKAKKNMAPDV